MRFRPKAFELDSGCGHTDLMQRARRHQRFSAGLAFGLLALIAELFGRSLTHRLNVGQHVSSSGYSGAEYYPFLLAAVKLLVALLLARLAWRFVRAHTAARAGRLRALAAVCALAAHLGSAGLRRARRPRRRRLGRGRLLAARVRALRRG